MLQALKKAISTVQYLLLAVALITLPASAAELLMLEADDCVYCQKFNEEIAPAYPKTNEGKLAPLRRINIAEPWPKDLAAIKEENLTPTFILIHNGQEVDRLIGYPGDEHFWFLLSELLLKLVYWNK